MGMAVKVKENICWLCGKRLSVVKEDGDIQYWWLCDCGVTTVPVRGKVLSRKMLLGIIGAYDRTHGKQARG